MLKNVFVFSISGEDEQFTGMVRSRLIGLVHVEGR